jgi:hypothetical protein
MAISNIKIWLSFLLLAWPVLLYGQAVKIVTNHVGYEGDKAKHAVIVTDHQLNLGVFSLVDANTGKIVFTAKPEYSGPVDKWKTWQFWTLDFSDYAIDGTYKLQINLPDGIVSSYPFIIGKNVLEQATISNVAYYFKGQRCSGLMDKADHDLLIAGKSADTIDAHGGWYDATGDYGKHLSHLAFSNYFSPQQIGLTDWSLFKSYALLSARPGTDFRQIDRRILDEAMYGADYLVRIQAKNGSFYRSVAAPGPSKLPKDRVIQANEGSYRIKQTKDGVFNKNAANKDCYRCIGYGIHL